MNLDRVEHLRPPRTVQRLLGRIGSTRTGAGRAVLLVLPGALLLTGALTGCTQVAAAPAPAASASSTTAASATPSAFVTAAAPLTCDDLAPTSQIVSALAGGESAEDWVLLPTSTAAGLITGEKAVQGAGGLSCSWSAGPPASETTPAVLTIAVLPDAADAWTAQLYGDGPTDGRRTFAGISAAASCGDPGCGASAVVGSSWVRVDLATGSREGGDSVFAKESDDEVFAAMRPAIESAFRTVQGASAERLRFPAHLTDGAGAADCRSFLAKVDLKGLTTDSTAFISTKYQITPQLYSIAGAASQRIGTSRCGIDGHNTVDYELASVTVAPGQAWAVDALASDAAARGASHVTELKGQASGERAITDCGGSGSFCTVVFSLGSTAVQIEDERARGVQVAEAVLAEAR